MRIQNIFLIILFSLPVVQLANHEWLLYWSLPSSPVQYYDCLLLESVWYCRRPTNLSLSRISYSSCPEINRRSFLELSSQNISAEELLDWSIPIDMAQTYAHHLSLAPLELEKYKSTFVCNCSENRFGLNCEYQSPNMNNSPITILTIQLTSTKAVAFFDQWCLNDMICNMGSNCLDWRYVCDGIEHCQFGEDESHCEYLEANECEVNEYRCRNGMCIPQEWFFDAVFDCQDESDEHRIERLQNAMRKCRLSPYRPECAERLCNSQKPFSCGDGECLGWQHIYDQQSLCSNYRDLFHRCEMKTMRNLRTTDNDGSCQASSNAWANLTEDNECTRAFRRLLATQLKSIEPFEKYCSLYFDFPRHSFISANVQTRYNKTILSSSILSRNKLYSLNATSRRPHYYCFNGSITCNGVVTTLNQSFCVSPIDILIQYNQWPFRHIACSSSFASPQPSQATNAHSLWRCKSNQRYISEWRINDGHIDCFNGEDELVSVDVNIIRPYRYRCSSSIPIQYVSTNQLGDGERNCQDGSDEISPFINWHSQQCLEDDLYTCEILRSDEKIRNVRLRFHYYCNSLWDTWDGNDERNCTNWICSKTFIQCNKTGQCIKPSWRCDDEWDCANGEDELNCNTSQPRFFLESKCNHSNEFFCITFDFIRDPENHRPCINYSQAGDDKEDCLGAHDERNTVWCREDNKMLGDRFRCANGSCLSPSQVCNGIEDCEEGTDEQVCYWMYAANQTTSSCHYPKFQCLNGTCIESDTCNKRYKCSYNEHLFWCPKSDVYRTIKTSWSNYYDFCMGSKEDSPPSKTSNQIDMRFSLSLVVQANPKLSSSICNHGLIIEEKTLNGLTIACFCPPNHYGDRCQYFSRRIPVRIGLDHLHRTDLAQILHIYVFLVCNQSRIVDYTQFIDSIQNSRVKHDRYLLYSRPKLSCNYSVRFEAFHSNISNVDLLFVWEYSITLDFLPSQRLAKILRFPLIEDQPIRLTCTNSICQNNGTCHVIINKQETGDSYCECSSEFFGRFCEKRVISMSCPCSPPAKCHHVKTGVLDGEHEWFCICPEGLLPPSCMLKNPACLSNPCMHNATCYAHAEIGNYTCICDKHHRGARCEMFSTSVTLYANAEDGMKSHYQHAFLLQLFGVRRGFTVLRQQTLIELYQLPLTIFFDSQNALTELGLIHVFEPEILSVTSVLHLLYANCSTQTSSQFSMNILDSVKCRNLMTMDKNKFDVHTFHIYCRENSNVQCFYTTHYFCQCDNNPSRAECVSFHLDFNECNQKSVCLNKGQCIHGDRLNRSNFLCICPLCTNGKLCQYTFGRFTVTIETLFVSIPLSFGYQLITPILMFVFGLVSNGISIFTFHKIITHRLSASRLSFGGCSVYLLINSIISQITLTLLLLRVIYLLYINVHPMSIKMNTNLCRSLPYMMSSSWFVSSWIMAFVTLTRSLSIIRPRSWLFIRSSQFASRVVLITILVVFISCLTYIFSYKIVSGTTEQRLESWCFLELSTSSTIYLRLTTLFHQIVPFSLNITSTLILLFHISRSKANSHHQTHFKSFIQVLYDRLEFVVAPFICFISQSPQIIILFLDSCQFINSYWFTISTLVAYYLSFVPQISIVFIYILPSPLYKEELMKTKLVKMIKRCG